MTNFGVGVYFLTVIWCVSFMLCWVSVRTGHYIGRVSVLISVGITIILLTVPRSDEHYSANFYDKNFIPRFATLSVLLTSLVAGIVYSFIYVCLTPAETRKIKRIGAREAY